jgi:hypothetical protein
MIRAVIVGINDYPSAPLSGCVNDADDVVSCILALGASLGNIRKIYNEDATKASIRDALRDMIACAQDGDHLLFHYSGHGSQVVTQDPGEPDGFDECLCPYDFKFADPSTAFRDDELANLLSSVPRLVAMTVVLDSCHSGDFRPVLDSLVPIARRAFPMPQNILSKLNEAKQSGRPPRAKRRAASLNTLVVSACASNETAADTVFDSRPNGAFTYYWLRKLASSGSVNAAFEAIATDLEHFAMHPQIDGSADILQPAAFVVDPAPLTRSATLESSAASMIVLDESWCAKVLGADFSVNLQVGLASSDTFRFEMTCGTGVPRRWSFVVAGDVQKAFDVGLGFRVTLRVASWRQTPSTLSFRLAIQIAPPFVEATTVVERELQLGLPSVPRDIPSPKSAADLLAMIELAKLNAPATPPTIPAPVLPRDGDGQWTGIVMVENFAGGLFGCRYEKNTDNNAFVPPGFIRDHVEVTLDPPASGNVYFVEWADSDPHIAKFQFHVGCSAFGGGKATFFLHCVRDPDVVREILGGERGPGNGHGRQLDASAPRS